MRIAEALKLRADLQRRLAGMEYRLRSNALVQEGEEPSEDPRELLEELDRVSSQLEELIVRINITNSTVRDSEGRTLAELIARRDSAIRKADILREFAEEAGNPVRRRSVSEIRIVSTVDVRALRKRIDDLCAEARETDVRIQEINWTNDLI